MTFPEVLKRIPAWPLALLCGALAALAQPPFGFLPGLLAYGGLMLLAERTKTLRGAFGLGWLAGLIYFAISCWWVAEAFYVDAATFGWMAPIAAGALAGGLALFWAAGLWLYRAVKPRGALRALIFAGAFGLAEFLRGHLFTGFPWDLPGESWPAGSPVSETAALVGAYGLTWITVALSAAAAVFATAWRDRSARITAAVAVAVLAGLFGYGALRPTPTGMVGRVRIIQPNQPELANYDAAITARILSDYIRLTGQPRPIPGPVTVIWPEGAIPEALDTLFAPGSASRGAVAAALQEGDTLLTGGYRVEAAGDDARYYNSLAVFRKTGGDLVYEGLYDKRRLVPFGEYLPLKPLLHAVGFQKLVPVGDGFSSGAAAAPLQVVGLGLIQPLICYEALFPGLTNQTARAFKVRPSLLVNVSTDAWFGPTSGPWQHLNQAGYRAIEAGVPMVRGTPTGVSAVIDAKGRITRDLSLGARGVIDADIPMPAGPTPYGQAGEAFFIAMLAVSSLITARRPRVPPLVA